MDLNEDIKNLEAQLEALREKAEAVEVEVEVEVESPLVEGASTLLKLPCEAWCFIFGLAGSGVGCQLEKDHEGEHALNLTSKNPDANFQIVWKLSE